MRYKHPASTEVLITVGEAADRLGVHPDTLKRWEKAGRIASTRTLGNHRRYVLADVEALREYTPEQVSA